jgi:Methyltransferase domain
MRRLVRTTSFQALRATNAVASLVGLKVIRANVLSEEWFRKVGHFVRMLDRVRDVEGDVVECGVGGGKSFAVIASLVRSSGRQRKVWGLSPWTRVDGWRNRSLSGAGQGEVRLRLGQMAVGSLAGVELVDGDLADTLAVVTGTIAFAHIDVVLAEAVRPCLEQLWPKLADGGIVSIGWFTASPADPVASFLTTVPKGEARLEQDPEWHGRRLIVKVASNTAATSGSAEVITVTA